ncbi:MAG TPA: helix-turn-helix domain-containing protein, partial [Longimicrobiaceae bacterium]|nr:helix-turn-helix domain-containing protein [Longimicrobiaceae bacterium]
ETEDLWTVTEVAALLNLRPKTIRNRVSLKKIPYVKVDGLLRFRPSEIRRWVAQGAVAARKSA